MAGQCLYQQCLYYQTRLTRLRPPLPKFHYLGSSTWHMFMLFITGISSGGHGTLTPFRKRSLEILIRSSQASDVTMYNIDFSFFSSIMKMLIIQVRCSDLVCFLSTLKGTLKLACKIVNYHFTLLIRRGCCYYYICFI